MSVDLHVLSDWGERLVCWRNWPTGPWWSSECQAGLVWEAGWHCFARKGTGGKADWVSRVPRLQQISISTARASKSFSSIHLAGRPHPQLLCQFGGSPVEELQWCEGAKTRPPRCGGVQQIQGLRETCWSSLKKQLWLLAANHWPVVEHGEQTLAEGVVHQGHLTQAGTRKIPARCRNTIFNYEGTQTAEQAFQKGWGISILREHGIIKVGKHLEGHLVQPRYQHWT